MFIVASKVGWFLVQPVSIILVLLLLGFVMGLAGWRRRGLFAVALSGLVLIVSAYTTVGYVAIGALEDRFARPAVMPGRVDGIIVLGGGMDADINKARGGYELNRSGDRFTEALRLALLYPHAKVAITGGAGALAAASDADSEAAAGAAFFIDFGIADDRLILEKQARNTEENAQLMKALVDAQPGETWLLVTSAFHMPRSVGLFRKAGFAVVPWPADYLATGAEGIGINLGEPAENLSVTSMAMREWAGLLVYRLTGKIDDIVPGP